jgi:hypothetical protein
MSAIFKNICIDFDTLLQQQSLRKMLGIVQKQAKTAEAKKRVDVGHYKDYDSDDWNPMYVGLFVEWLCENFLNFFGQQFNIGQVKMLASEYSSEKDLGTDGYGISLMKGKMNRTTEVKPGDKVYIQVKGTFNANKTYKANDGSRIPNFAANAMSNAIVNGLAYRSRYVLFTTGKDIHHTLNDMTHGLIEVINFKKISKLMDDNIFFLNYLRSQVSLTQLDVPEPSMDEEAKFNAKNM